MYWYGTYEHIYGNLPANACVAPQPAADGMIIAVNPATPELNAGPSLDPPRINTGRLDRPTHYLFQQRMLSSGSRIADGDQADWYFIPVGGAGWEGGWGMIV